MKTIAVAFAAFLFVACSAQRDVQVEMVQAQLIRVDTLYRNSGYVQLLTWRSDQRMQFVHYADMKARYPVGARMLVLLPR